MNAISTHVLDTAKGAPAAGVPVLLEFLADHHWTVVANGVTNNDGRYRFEDHELAAGQYRIIFETAAYFEGRPAFYPSVSVVFLVNDNTAHYHVPLLLSPYGYSTYRGS